MTKIKVVGIIILILSISLIILSSSINDKNIAHNNIIDAINKQKTFTQEISRNIFYVYRNRDASVSELNESIDKYVDNISNNKNLITYENSSSAYNSSIFDDNTAIHSFDGISWHHYFSNKRKSFYAAIGVGFYSFEINSIGSTDSKAGFLIGGGYEFAAHYQVAIRYCSGKTFSIQNEIELKHLAITFTVIAF